MQAATDLEDFDLTGGTVQQHWILSGGVVVSLDLNPKRHSLLASVLFRRELRAYAVDFYEDGCVV